MQYTIIKEGQNIYTGTYAQCLLYCQRMHYMVYNGNNWELQEVTIELVK